MMRAGLENEKSSVDRAILEPKNQVEVTMRNKWLLVLTIGLLVVGLVVGGTALAQGPRQPNATPQAFVDEDGDGVCDVCGGNETLRKGVEAMRGMMSRMSRSPMQMGGRYGNGSLSEVVAEQLGITVAELQALHTDGTSLKDVIEANNGSVEAVVNAFIATRQEALATAVANGRLTQEQADQMLAQMRAEVTEHLESTEHECDTDRAWGRELSGNTSPAQQPQGGMRGMMRVAPRAGRA
jgi:hypothetical protein